MKQLFERFRIPMSQLFIVAILFLICTTHSYWEDRSEIFTFILFFVGLILVSIAALGRLWCAVYIAGYKDNLLVQDGPYSVCRNPLYLFSFIGIVGVGLATETLLFPFVLVIFFAFYYPSVIAAEAGRLSELFGADFAEYEKKVPAFFPKMSLLHEPTKYEVNPLVFKKSIFSALWFIWITGFIEVAEGLKELGFLPTYWTIY